MKGGNRGISAIVATVLIILLLAVSVSIIWLAVLPMLNDESSYSLDDVNLNIVSDQGYTFYDSEKEILEFQVARGSDDEGSIEFRFVVTFEDGNSETSAPFEAPEPNSRKVYPLGMKEEVAKHGKPVSVKISTPSKKVLLTGNIVATFSGVKISSGVSKREYSEVISFGSLSIYLDSCAKLDVEGATYFLENSLYGGNVTDDCFEIVADHVTLDCQGNFVFANAQENMVFADDVISPTIRDCKIQLNAGKNGIYLKDVNGGTVTDNFVNGSEDQGIYLLRAKNVEVLDNHVILSSQDGIRLQLSEGVLVKGNIANDNAAKGIQLYNSDNNTIYQNELVRNDNNGGIQLRKADNNYVADNYIEDSKNYGIWVWDSAENTFMNNYIKDTQRTYASFPGRGMFLRNSAAKYNKIYCGVFENNGVDIVDWGKDNVYYGSANLSIDGSTQVVGDYNCSQHCNWNVSSCLGSDDSEEILGKFKISFDEEDLYNASDESYPLWEDVPVIVIESLGEDKDSIETGGEETDTIYLRWAPMGQETFINGYPSMNASNGSLEVFYKDVDEDYMPANRARFSHRHVYKPGYVMEDIAGINENSDYSYSISAYVREFNLYLFIAMLHYDNVSGMIPGENVTLMIGGEDLTSRGGSFEWFGRNNEVVDQDNAQSYDLFWKGMPSGMTEGDIVTSDGLIVLDVLRNLDADEVILDVKEEGDMNCSSNSQCPSSSLISCNGSYSFVETTSYSCELGNCVVSGGGVSASEYCPNGCTVGVGCNIGNVSNGSCGDGVCQDSVNVSLSISDGVSLVPYGGRYFQISNVSISSDMVYFFVEGYSEPFGLVEGSYAQVDGVRFYLSNIYYLSYEPGNSTAHLVIGGETGFSCPSDCSVNGTDLCFDVECPAVTEIKCNGSYSYARTTSFGCSQGNCIANGGGVSSPTYCSNGCQAGVGCLDSSYTDLSVSGIELQPIINNYTLGESLTIIPTINYSGLENNSDFWVEVGAYNSYGVEVDSCGSRATFVNYAYPFNVDMINTACSLEIDFEGNFSFRVHVDSRDDVDENAEWNNWFNSSSYYFRNLSSQTF